MNTKPGYMTTEFYMMLANIAVTWANARYGWNIDPMAIVGMFIGTGGYAISRGNAKKG